MEKEIGRDIACLVESEKGVLDFLCKKIYRMKSQAEVFGEEIAARAMPKIVKKIMLIKIPLKTPGDGGHV